MNLIQTHNINLIKLIHLIKLVIRVNLMIKYQNILEKCKIIKILKREQMLPEN